MVDVGKYTIYGSYGIWIIIRCQLPFLNLPDMEISPIITPHILQARPGTERANVLVGQ